MVLVVKPFCLVKRHPLPFALQVLEGLPPEVQLALGLISLLSSTFHSCLASTALNLCRWRGLSDRAWVRNHLPVRTLYRYRTSSRKLPPEISLPEWARPTTTTHRGAWRAQRSSRASGGDREHHRSGVGGRSPSSKGGSIGGQRRGGRGSESWRWSPRRSRRRNGRSGGGLCREGSSCPVAAGTGRRPCTTASIVGWTYRIL